MGDPQVTMVVSVLIDGLMTWMICREYFQKPIWQFDQVVSVHFGAVLNGLIFLIFRRPHERSRFMGKDPI